jgi:hypothetical protein
MRKDMREFIRRLEAAGLRVQSTPGDYRVLRGGKPLRKANGMPSIRWREPRSSNCGSSASIYSRTPEMPKPADLSVTGLRR